MSVVLNCNTHTADDVEVIANLVRMRLKSKAVANQYIACMKYEASVFLLAGLCLALHLKYCSIYLLLFYIEKVEQCVFVSLAHDFKCLQFAETRLVDYVTFLADNIYKQADKNCW